MRLLSIVETREVHLLELVGILLQNVEELIQIVQVQVQLIKINILGRASLSGGDGGGLRRASSLVSILVGIDNHCGGSLLVGGDLCAGLRVGFLHSGLHDHDWRWGFNDGFADSEASVVDLFQLLIELVLSEDGGCLRGIIELDSVGTDLVVGRQSKVVTPVGPSLQEDHGASLELRRCYLLVLARNDILDLIGNHVSHNDFRGVNLLGLRERVVVRLVGDSVSDSELDWDGNGSIFGDFSGGGQNRLFITPRNVVIGGPLYRLIRGLFNFMQNSARLVDT